MEENSKSEENTFGGMEAVRPMLYFRRLISRDPINKLYIRLYYLTSEEKNSKRNKPNDGNIVINISRGGLNGNLLVIIQDSMIKAILQMLSRNTYVNKFFVTHCK